MFRKFKNSTHIKYVRSFSCDMPATICKYQIKFQVWIKVICLRETLPLVKLSLLWWWKPLEIKEGESTKIQLIFDIRSYNLNDIRCFHEFFVIEMNNNVRTVQSEPSIFAPVLFDKVFSKPQRHLADQNAIWRSFAWIRMLFISSTTFQYFDFLAPKFKLSQFEFYVKRQSYSSALMAL